MSRFVRLGQNPAFWRICFAPAIALWATALVASGHGGREHIIIAFACIIMIYVPRLLPAFIGLVPFFLFVISYDALRFVTPALHRLVTVSVDGVYHLERFLFGVRLADGRVVVPPELLAGLDWRPLLLASGFAYFCHIYEVFGLGIYWVRTNPDLVRRFGWAFLLLSFMGFVTWYIYPAAPPWYLERYGAGPVDLAIAGDPARLALVDQLLGISLFHDYYARSSNVFGALPSMHAAYPLLCWLYVRRSDLARWHTGFLGFWVLMAFAAVFLGHHYVIDVSLGTIYAVVAYAIAEELLHRRWPTLAGGRAVPALAAVNARN
jgi:inositol phosphorylceramide synthase catalytic subunit